MKQFTGSFTALITPFKDGLVDEQLFVELIERQIKAGTHGLVPTGTTGESPTLNYEEHGRVTEICVKAVAGRADVMAGTGSNSTLEAITMTQHAQKVGADAALIMTPYYNKPTQEGIFQHFKAIHDVTEIPIFLYNIPGRSIVDITDETLVRLAELERIVGIKDATGDLSRPASLKKELGDRFIQLSGEDESAVEFNELGGLGCISVTANIVPEMCAKMHELCLSGDFSAAKTIQNKIMDLHKAMFCETSPIPVKYAASLMGLCSDEMRLPLVSPAEKSQLKIRAALKALELV